MIDKIYALQGKEVEVVASGVTYRGVLIEVSEETVHLKTEMQWVSVPVAAVSEIRGVDEALTPSVEKFVDSSFYFNDDDLKGS